MPSAVDESARQATERRHGTARSANLETAATADDRDPVVEGR